MKKLILSFICVFALTNINFAQKSQTPETPLNCDQMLARFDQVISQINSQPPEKKVIVVAYLGKGEKTRIYNQQRLQSIKRYFVNEKVMYRGVSAERETYPGVSEEKIVLTEGKNRIGLAMIEFYLNGELFDKFYVAKRGGVCSFC